MRNDDTPRTAAGRALDAILRTDRNDPSWIDARQAILSIEDEARREGWDAALVEALQRLPRATCYRTHTQRDENRGVFGAVWLADVERALLSRERK